MLNVKICDVHWVVSSEIIPETHREGHQGTATAALMIGLTLMLFLDWTFG